ncbi:FadR/GntR family transcriptional regulator [Allorhizobium borbori]|uniref:DNA-binding FadR family transcriptional regulator n=1 Tax=Allorhizobium borbori TaxID=485907 RepID=A0A7W6K3M2_9HYPH|nr:FadR/GntR family transcriptional regulator [Allorhizobium borbori]MBB4103651.1 DNA-binding FadR family transcriptional regulator [Allorhizobium borbori]
MSVDFGQIRRNEHLPARIAAQIGSDIQEGRLKPGDKLPTEHFLAKSLGVSRSVVREAIAQLRNEGLVETRQGVGAFVTERQSRTIRIDEGELFKRDSFRDLFQLRIPLEIEAAGLAAVHYKEADLERIDEALARMTGSEKWTDEGIDADLAFHRAIAEATGNDYFALFIGFIAERISLAIAAARARVELEEIVNVTIDEHVVVRNAIASRNPKAAREAMRAHLLGAASRVDLTLETY